MPILHDQPFSSRPRRRNAHRPAVLQAKASHAPARRRRLRRALFWLLLLAALAGAWFYFRPRIPSLSDLRRSLLPDDHPLFAIKRIDVSTDGILTADEILRSARVSTNMNLLALAPGDVRASVESNPLVARARIARQFPSTLRIAVEERVPIARVVLPGGPAALTIAADGHVMGPRSVRTSLPLLLGLRDRALAPGDLSSDPLLPDLVAILRALSEPDLRDRLSVDALDIRDRSRIRMVLASGEEVLLSTQNYLPKLRQLPVMLSIARDRSLPLSTFDMTVDRSYPAR